MEEWCLLPRKESLESSKASHMPATSPYFTMLLVNSSRHSRISTKWTLFRGPGGGGLPKRFSMCSLCHSFLLSKLRRGPRGASYEKFHAAPSKKQARFLEGPLPLRAQGKSDLLRSPFASKKVLCGTVRGLPPVAPLLKAFPRFDRLISAKIG